MVVSKVRIFVKCGVCDDKIRRYDVLYEKFYIILCRRHSFTRPRALGPWHYKEISMPIKIPNELPAVKTLENENIFVMTEKRASTQDIRPLKIAILNLMPLKEDTELQLLRSFSNTPLQVDVTFITMTNHESKNTSSSHINKFYTIYEEIKHNKYDGLIITGAPLENITFEEVINVSESAIEGTVENVFIKNSTASQAVLRRWYEKGQYSEYKCAGVYFDEDFKNDMDDAPPIKSRIKAMKKFHKEGIRTTCFISPIFPEITDPIEIIEEISNFCNYIWLENLNLRGGYKKTILDYIDLKYPELMPLYKEIYTYKDMTYWKDLDEEIRVYANENDFTFITKTTPNEKALERRNKLKNKP